MSLGCTYQKTVKDRQLHCMQFLCKILQTEDFGEDSLSKLDFDVSNFVCRGASEERFILYPAIILHGCDHHCARTVLTMFLTVLID